MEGEWKESPWLMRIQKLPTLKMLKELEEFHGRSVKWSGEIQLEFDIETA